jgi:hypothetical protein
LHIRDIEKQIDKIHRLRYSHVSSPEVRAWKAQTERILTAVFGPRSLHVNQFNKIVIEPPMIPVGASQDFFDEAYREGLEEAEALLCSFVDESDDIRKNAGNDEKDDNNKEDLNELTCPACGSKKPQFIELRTIGNIELQAGVPIFRGKKQSIRDVAYYKCARRNRPFYVEVSKAAIHT